MTRVLLLLVIVFACGHSDPVQVRPNPDGGEMLEGDCPFRPSLPDGGSPCTGDAP